MESPLQQREAKPEDSMPFFGDAFFQAVEGYSAHVAIGYIRLLWHYYRHTKCKGLPDDDEYLRNVSRCPEAEWCRVKGIIFDDQYFFCRNGDGLWHQKTSKEIHDREVDLYLKRVAWAKRARDAKAGTIPITKDATKDGLSSVERVQYGKEYERVVKQMDEISHTYAGHQTWRREDKERFGKLKARREELRKMLGIKV